MITEATGLNYEAYIHVLSMIMIYWPLLLTQYSQICYLDTMVQVEKQTEIHNNSIFYY